MSAEKSGSLRKAINAHCKSCIYDDKAAGTWRAQVTLCTVTNCALYDVRPTTDVIAESVYEYYGETSPSESPERLKSAQNEPFLEETAKSHSERKKL
jgi:hypothetical protein